MKRLVLFVVCSFTASIAAQQALQKFEVASVKRNDVPDSLQRTRITLTPGRYSATNVTLRDVIKHAYSVIDAQISGGPDWMNSTKFNVEGTAPGAKPEEIRPLVQRLLADRFRLKVTNQTQTRPIYRLVRARQDEKVPKGLTPDSCPIDTSNGQPRPCNTVAGGPSQLIGISITMVQLAKQLSSWPYAELGRLVVDATGLDGSYRFSMQYAATREYEGLRVNNDPNLPSFTTALQEQVGLKLESARGPVEVLVIDSAELPTPD
jgi:uncharacterized protein (TIGR03435 family)